VFILAFPSNTFAWYRSVKRRPAEHQEPLIGIGYVAEKSIQFFLRNHFWWSHTFSAHSKHPTIAQNFMKDLFRLWD
jgi:hypothetical protein